MAILADDLTTCLEGAYDLHVHSGPDVMARKGHDIEFARRAAEARMGGFVIKSHHVPTADRAFLVRQVVPNVEVFGSIALNNFVGGINPQAVEVAGRLEAKVVWFPTVDAANEKDKIQVQDPAKLAYWAALQKELQAQGRLRPPIEVMGGDGKLLPDVIEVLRLVKEHDMVLETGHLAPAEIYAVVKAARELGIVRIVITHPEFPSIGLSVGQQRELAAYNVFFEHCFTTPNTGKVSWSNLFDMVRSTGPERNVLATDLGQPNALYPVEGLAAFISHFHQAGFSVPEIRRMTVTNPQNLLH